jgi:hypothetical protein
MPYHQIKLIKIILALLMFTCLADVPYGYFQFVRFIAMIAFGLLAAQASQMGRQNEMIIYGALALLFQPIFKISLGRGLWNMVDVIVGIGLLISAFNSPPKAK